ncbi:SDR family NAD(P)-dependent oxidoreductase [Hahella aquimaris]|uniref:SDR family NAD(P)-dependent oxidoreductase n=1 Tax=Hahella sp. HNIBRBA332 TaxID=3015983 RepID=UPI00273BAA98|nr:SDR family NAD(P)-dependent oxidoreductase [Hahella sp. HNIBRBA332]WLQ16049.1 SDR family NAD(P)-dependent oxidoreductase [Hahella sp. HNIBRBA332]
MTQNCIVIVGASGAIGAALTHRFASAPNAQVFAFSRSPKTWEQINIEAGRLDFSDEDSIRQAAKFVAETGPVDRVIVTAGLLHTQTMRPEKALKELESANFEACFLANTIGPMLVAKHFLGALSHQRPAVFAALSARVGSISDNRLGGWYAYRSSKAALNMALKTASIEMARRNKQAIVVGLHPGTVASALSAPFLERVPPQQLFTPDQAAGHLMNVIEGLRPEDTGKLFAWDGSEIPF